MSESVLIALITSVGALIGGIASAAITAYGTIKAAEKKQVSLPTSSANNQQISRWSWGIFIIGAVVGGIVFLGVAAFAGFLPITFPSFSPVPFYRYNNLSNGDHMYTTNPNKNLDGWIFEGNEGYVYMAEKVGTIPLYEFYNSKTLQHFYTIDKNSGNNNSGFELLGIAAYVYASEQDKTIPLYRYFNPEIGGYFYTTNFGEVGNGNNGLKYEKIECYVLAEKP
jgi:MFS family permease